MSLLFSRATAIEGEIASLLDNISNSTMLFSGAIKNYLNDKFDVFHQQMEEVKKLESDVDDLRREIRYKLYTKMLIPESRGDMLSLLETIDNVIDTAEEVLIEFEVVRPDFPVELVEDLVELVDLSAKAADYTVMAARCYIKNEGLINDYINKTYFHEHEADKIEIRLKRKLYGSDEIVSDLARKIQLRRFVELIAKLSDESQDVCERLSVATIKRSI